MIKNIVVCPKCLRRLDFDTKSLYEKICHFYIDGFVFAKDWKDIGCHPILRRLEKKRFIVTLDIENGYLLIKPRGHVIYIKDGEENHIFCAFQDIHL